MKISRIGKVLIRERKKLKHMINEAFEKDIPVLQNTEILKQRRRVDWMMALVKKKNGTKK